MPVTCGNDSLRCGCAPLLSEEEELAERWWWWFWWWCCCCCCLLRLTVCVMHDGLGFRVKGLGLLLLVALDRLRDEGRRRAEEGG